MWIESIMMLCLSLILSLVLGAAIVHYIPTFSAGAKIAKLLAPSQPSAKDKSE